MATPESRPRGVYVVQKDLTDALPADFGRLMNYALADAPDGRTYALCSEGVGWMVDADNPLEVEGIGRAATVTLDELQSAPGKLVDLADFVRTFGGRLEANFSMWHWKLSDVPQTYAPTPKEFAAIDALWGAYMALNATDHGGHVSALAYERTPGVTPDPTAMGYVSVAVRTAWEQLGLPGEELRSIMLESDTTAEVSWTMWKESQYWATRSTD